MYFSLPCKGWNTNRIDDDDDGSYSEVLLCLQNLLYGPMVFFWRISLMSLEIIFDIYMYIFLPYIVLILK